MSKSIQRQRYRFWKADPHCYWCGVLTVLPSKKWKGPPLPNVATIDHLRPRHDPTRQEPARNQEVRHVLACFKCNVERDAAERAAWPKEKMYELGGGAKPLDMKPLEELERIESILMHKRPKRKRDRESVYASIVAVRDAIQRAGDGQR